MLQVPSNFIHPGHLIVTVGGIVISNCYVMCLSYDTSNVENAGEMINQKSHTFVLFFKKDTKRILKLLV